MKRPTLLPTFVTSAALVLAFAAGCSSGGSQPTGTGGTSTSSGSPTMTTGTAAPDEGIAEVDLPTQAEADAMAAAEINEANEDEAYEQLLEEIENDLPPDDG
jgi:hypothetical protein